MSTLTFGDIASVDAAIANGASLSAAIPLTGKRLFAIQMPAAWTTANLTFQSSADGVTYDNLYDSAGAEVTVQAASARYIVLLDPAQFQGVNFLKVRSGTAGAAVNQVAAATIKLVTVV